jgi:hypothetical protein
MKRFALSAAALAILSGTVFVSAAQAAPYGYGHRHVLTPHERVAIARSQANLNRLKWQVRADGRLTFFERMRLNVAQARHNSLVYRYQHN